LDEYIELTFSASLLILEMLLLWLSIDKIYELITA